jgi:O-antigen/teichoic acid export membrane protein
MVKATPLPSLERRLLTGGAWTFGSRMVMIFTELLLSALLARLLSPQGREDWVGERT